MAEPRSCRGSSCRIELRVEVDALLRPLAGLRSLLGNSLRPPQQVFALPLHQRHLLHPLQLLQTVLQSLIREVALELLGHPGHLGVDLVGVVQQSPHLLESRLLLLIAGDLLLLLLLAESISRIESLPHGSE